ncbi:non-functional pseudokinase ZED1-like [Prunus yedoensis var. nudiflora]|uniref:Non-functional pseudokinase ZED1-like n=1 Tax=Prunus yedoensis var. nudiflora TaxID=2094558 RepID=A0A314ZTL0_PRUYE|nr:non-functional pseudokinase ZED1-like [Prunus yedoensis var. nudiflora]
MPSKLWQLLPCLGKVGRDADIESSYYKNLSKLLEDLIASCDGTSLPVHCYSADDLIRATNNFHPSCIVRKGSNCTMFRGFLNDRSVIIANYSFRSLGNEDDVRSRAIRDIVISIQMSNHENVLKLLGCCLEFPVPALVLENAAKGVLEGDGSLRGDNEDESLSLPWKTRLLIAKKLASAVTYLHTALPRPIIHRDLNPQCIFLDDDYVPKLCNFSLSITIPLMESEVEDDVRGTIGYLDPAYMSSGRILEKTDVYSFGVLLLVLLTGRRAFWLDVMNIEDYTVTDYVKSRAYQLQAIVDPKILEEVGGNEQVEHQLHDFLEIALSCTQEIGGRPYMGDVARELVQIDESILPS